MGADAPRPGDWFVVKNALTSMRAPEGPTGVHRFIVKSSWPGPRATLLPRSTTYEDGLPHPAHAGRCGFATCRLDKDGRIGLSLCTLDLHDLSDYSCREPDDDVIDWVQTATPLLPPKPRRIRR